MAGIDNMASQYANQYKGKEDDLKKSYGLDMNLAKLLALSKMKREQDAIAMDMQQQVAKQNAGQGGISSIGAQLESEVFGRKQEEVAQQVGTELQKKLAREQQAVQQMAQSASQPQQNGIGAMAYRSGGMVQKFREGGQADGKTEEEKRAELGGVLGIYASVPSALAELNRMQRRGVAKAAEGVGKFMVGDEYFESKFGPEVDAYLQRWGEESGQPRPPLAPTAEQKTPLSAEGQPKTDADKKPTSPTIDPLINKNSTTTASVPNVDMTRVNELVDELKGLGGQYKAPQRTSRGDLTEEVKTAMGDDLAQRRSGADIQTEVEAVEKDARKRLYVDEYRDAMQKNLERMQDNYDAQNDPSKQAFDRIIAGLSSMAGSSSPGAAFAKSAQTSLAKMSQQQESANRAAKELFDATNTKFSGMADLENKVMNLGQEMYKTLTTEQSERAKMLSTSVNSEQQADTIQNQMDQNAQRDRLQVQGQALAEQIRAEMQRMGIISKESFQRAMMDRDSITEVTELLLKVQAGYGSLRNSKMADPMWQAEYSEASPEERTSMLREIQALQEEFDNSPAGQLVAQLVEMMGTSFGATVDKSGQTAPQLSAEERSQGDAAARSMLGME